MEKNKNPINRKSTFPSLSRTFLVSKNLLVTAARPFLTRIWSWLSSFVKFLDGHLLEVLRRTFAFYQIATLSVLLIKYVSLSYDTNLVRVSQMNTLTRINVCRTWQYIFKKCLSDILNKDLIRNNFRISISNRNKVS